MRLIDIFEDEEQIEVLGRDIQMLSNPTRDQIIQFIRLTREKASLGFGFSHNIYMWDMAIMSRPREIWSKYTSVENQIDLFVMSDRPDDFSQLGDSHLFSDGKVFVRIFARDPSRLLRNAAFKNALPRLSPVK